MTYPAPDVLPYDEWFDPNYKYNPDEEMDLAPSSVEPQDEEETMHEKAYKIATSKYNPFAVWVSENIHYFDSKD